jgi:hypothetical protein
MCRATFGAAAMLALAACGQSIVPPSQPSNTLSSDASRSGAMGQQSAVLDSALASQATAHASSSAVEYKGCTVFAAGDTYNADVSGSAIDGNSVQYIQSVTSVDNTGFYGMIGIEPVNIATSRTGLYMVHPKVKWHSFPVPYPWSSSFRIEPAGDAHLIVLLATPPSCHLFEAYSSSFSANELSAYSGANWDLAQPYKITSSSSMASGLSLFAGSVRHEEIATGIHHALNFKAFSQAPCNCYVAPASGTDGVSYAGRSTAYQLPYGAHLRLRSNFNDSNAGPQAKAILEALKHYGMYLADTGGHYENNNGIYLADPTDGGTWDSQDLGALGNLKFADFDVLKVGAVTHR